MPTFAGSHPATYGLNYIWDVGTLSWVKETQPGGGVGAAVTIVDGGDVAQGTTTDVAVTTDASGTISSKLRGLVKIANSVWDSSSNVLGVKDIQVRAVVHGEASLHIDGNGEKGVGLMAIRKDTPVALAPVADNYQEVISDSSGRVYVNVQTPLLVIAL